MRLMLLILEMLRYFKHDIFRIIIFYTSEYSFFLISILKDVMLSSIILHFLSSTKFSEVSRPLFRC